jgi:hypothetical protein
VPVDYKDRADAYIDDVCIPALELAHKAGLVDAVDGFCEGIAFTPAQIERVFDQGTRTGSAGQAARRAIVQPGRGESWPRSMVRYRPITSNTWMKTA